MNSTDVQKEIRDRWNRTLAICGSIGVPLVSVAIWLIVSGTKLVDKVDSMTNEINKINNRLDRTDAKIDKVSNHVDSISQHQHDESVLRGQGYSYQRYINGKLVTIHIP